MYTSPRRVLTTWLTRLLIEQRPDQQSEWGLSTLSGWKEMGLFVRQTSR